MGKEEIAMTEKNDNGRERELDLGDGAILPDQYNPMEPKLGNPADSTSAMLEAVSRRRLPLGSLLVEAGSINNDQLEMALAEQRRTHNLLGEILVSLGFASEEIITEAVGRQTGIAFLRLAREPIAPNLLKLVPEEIYRRHRLVPIGIEGSILKLAMANPFDVVALDTIRANTGLVPFPYIAPWSDIAAAIEKSFSTIESFDETFEKLCTPVEADTLVCDDKNDMVARGPLVELVDQLFLRGVEECATSIHIEPEDGVVRVRYRIDSILQPGPMIPKKLQTAVAARIKIMAGLKIEQTRVCQKGRIRFSVKGRQVNLRVSFFPCHYGENIVLRVQDRASVAFSLEKLGLSHDDLKKFQCIIKRPHGIVLVTGPTDCGKTTTLYTMLSALNTIDVNVMTIEDPIEYELTLARQTEVNRRANITFAEGLRGILDQDPDIIMISEIRNLETAQMALRAAMTGRIVLSAMYVNSAFDAIPNLIGMGVDPLQLTDNIVAVIGQRLTRVVCPKCYKRVPTPEDRHAELKAAAQEVEKEENIVFDFDYVAGVVGCHDCRWRGYRGRQPLTEIFEMSREARDLILRGRDRDEVVACARRNGMRTLHTDGLRRVLAHKLTFEELDRVVKTS